MTLEASTLSHGSANLSTGVRLHYVVAGDGPRTLVLVHGYPQTWWSWRHVFEPLVSVGFRVIAPDYRGAGGSSKPHRVTTSALWPQISLRFSPTFLISTAL